MQAEKLFLSLPDVLTADDAAKAICITGNTMRELLRSGQLRGFKVGTHWRVSKTALLEFMGEADG